MTVCVQKNVHVNKASNDTFIYKGNEKETIVFTLSISRNNEYFLYKRHRTQEEKFISVDTQRYDIKNMRSKQNEKII